MNAMATPAPPLRCFPKPAEVPELTDTPGAGWVDRWVAEYCPSPLQLRSGQEEALACLIPALLCGEQSAQQVFHFHARRLRGSGMLELELALRGIEAEEDAHERVLQVLAASVVRPPELHQRKRRAQRFYSSLAREVTLAQHFARIEALDSCVCSIMHSLAGACRGVSDPLHHLFTSIKIDEARHVAVSRRYARMLGVDASQREDQRHLIGTRIVEFLLPEADSFECLGVDADRLFRRLRSGAGK